MSERAKQKEEEERIFMMVHRAFARRVVQNWIVPSKSHVVTSSHGVSRVEDSPEGKYPSMIVPSHHLDEILVLMPEKHFEKLLEAWMKQNPEMVKSVQKMAAETVEQREEDSRVLALRKRVLGDQSQ